MPIHGPLRELGIHDVFQLLDLSRKTGTLSVRSSLRDNEGTIFFQDGRVLFASIRSNPYPLGDLLLRSGKVTEADLERAVAMQREGHGSKRIGEILVECGALSRRELERHIRFQVEEVVFELLSWNEGYFTFEDGDVSELIPEGAVSISTESLLMEGARRIDEWSQIAARIPDLYVVASLADVSDDREMQLDLLPDEWEVLSMVDGRRNVRGLARELGRSEFDVAKVLYGLVCTGVVLVTPGGADSAGVSIAASSGADTGGIIMDPADSAALLDRVRERVRKGDVEQAVMDLQRMVRSGGASREIHAELGFASAMAGKLDDAASALTAAADDAEAKTGTSVQRALTALRELQQALNDHYGNV